MEQVYPQLEQLLQDENWWVRFHAARSIGHSKDGESRLEEVHCRRLKIRMPLRWLAKCWEAG
ncbi:MAG: HEAT repeat domain-containing protein [Saccharofermentanales bacterium]